MSPRDRATRDAEDRAYWQGTADEKLKALFIRMGRVEEKVDSLITWRAYVLGAAAAISTVVTAVVTLAINWLRGWRP